MGRNPLCFFSPNVADGIGDTYTLWTANGIGGMGSRQLPARVFISSATGTGKTTFIIDTLLAYAAEMNRNVLYLCNRSALEAQLKSRLAKKSFIGIVYSNDERYPSYIKYAGESADYRDVKEFRFPNSNASVRIMNYQALAGYINESRNKGYKNPFYYVILDEAHFFMEDSAFNPNTAMILDRIFHFFVSSAIVFMSATLDSMENYFFPTLAQRYFSIVQGNSQQNVDRIPLYSTNCFRYKNLYQKANYIPLIYPTPDELRNIIGESDPMEKWLIFVASLKQGEDLQKLLKATGKSVFFLTAAKKKSVTWEKIVEHEQFKQQVLITTRVLDNGINIKDPAVKHIVLPFCAKDEFLQMLGRKRCDENEQVKVYVQLPKNRTLNGLLRQNEYVLSRILQYEKIESDMRKLQSERETLAPWQFANENERIKNKKIDLLERLWERNNAYVRKAFYVNYFGMLELNPLAKIQVEENYNLFFALKKQNSSGAGYLSEIRKWLGGSCLQEFAPVDLPDCHALADFIKEYLDRPIPAEQQERVYQSFMVLLSMECNARSSDRPEICNKINGIRKGVKRRKSTINKSLICLELPYQIRKVKKDWVLSEQPLPKTETE